MEPPPQKTLNKPKPHHITSAFGSVTTTTTSTPPRETSTSRALNAQTTPIQAASDAAAVARSPSNLPPVSASGASPFSSSSSPSPSRQHVSRGVAGPPSSPPPTFPRLRSEDGPAGPAGDDKGTLEDSARTTSVISESLELEGGTNHDRRTDNHHHGHQGDTTESRGDLSGAESEDYDHVRPSNELEEELEVHEVDVERDTPVPTVQSPPSTTSSAATASIPASVVPTTREEPPAPAPPRSISWVHRITRLISGSSPSSSSHSPKVPDSSVKESNTLLGSTPSTPSYNATSHTTSRIYPSEVTPYGLTSQTGSTTAPPPSRTTSVGGLFTGVFDWVVSRAPSTNAASTAASEDASATSSTPSVTSTSPDEAPDPPDLTPTSPPLTLSSSNPQPITSRLLLPLSTSPSLSTLLLGGIMRSVGYRDRDRERERIERGGMVERADYERDARTSGGRETPRDAARDAPPPQPPVFRDRSSFDRERELRDREREREKERERNNRRLPSMPNINASGGGSASRRNTVSSATYNPNGSSPSRTRDREREREGEYVHPRSLGEVVGYYGLNSTLDGVVELAPPRGGGGNIQNALGIMVQRPATAAPQSRTGTFSPGASSSPPAPSSMSGWPGPSSARSVESFSSLVSSSTNGTERWNGGEREKPKGHKRSKSWEERCKQLEEKWRAAEERSKAMEDRCTIAEDKNRGLEERTRTAEQRARIAEEKVRTTDDKVKIMQEKWKLEEDKRTLEEERARAAREMCVGFEERCRKAEERCREVEEKNRRLEALVKELRAARITGLETKKPPQVNGHERKRSRTADSIGKEMDDVPLPTSHLEELRRRASLNLLGRAQVPQSTSPASVSSSVGSRMSGIASSLESTSSLSSRSNTIPMRSGQAPKGDINKATMNSGSSSSGASSSSSSASASASSEEDDEDEEVEEEDEEEEEEEEEESSSADSSSASASSSVASSNGRRTRLTSATTTAQTTPVPAKGHIDLPSPTTTTPAPRSQPSISSLSSVSNTSDYSRESRESDKSSATSVASVKVNGRHIPPLPAIKTSASPPRLVATASSTSTIRPGPTSGPAISATKHEASLATSSSYPGSSPSLASSPPPPPPPPPSIAPSASFSTLSEQLAQHRSSETFLTRTDSWSGAQVIQAVHDINSQIVQFAASVTEVCRFGVREFRSEDEGRGPGARSGRSGVESSRSYVDTSPRLGSSLTHLLATYDHSTDPILVQLALQMLVCVAARKAWESFCLGLPGKSDGVLGVIYKNLREFEPQPTSAKWRSLTHSHIHSIYPTLSTYSATELAETVVKWTVDILSLAGFVGVSTGGTPTSSAFPQSQGSTPQAQAPPLALLRTQLRHIMTALTKLENVLRQDILSTTFDLVIPEWGGVFVSGQMSDAFGGAPGDVGAANGSGGKVLGCVEIGLVCRTRVGLRGLGLNSPISPETPSPITASLSGSGGRLLNGATGANGSGLVGGVKPEAVYDERLLLSPKVVLESVVDLL